MNLSEKSQKLSELLPWSIPWLSVLCPWLNPCYQDGDLVTMGQAKLFVLYNQLLVCGIYSGFYYNDVGAKSRVSLNEEFRPRL